jgi:dienelactone hydrolase
MHFQRGKLMSRIVSVVIALLATTPALAEMVRIPWHTSNSSAPWVPDNQYIDGWSKNFMNGTLEERGKTQATGELQADMSRPHGTNGPIPFVIMLHGCDGFSNATKNWAREWGGKFIAAGYGVLVLDSFTTRGLGPDGICSDPSQLGWARRRADDAYAALDWLIDQKLAEPKRVYVIGRSNGATTTLIIMNRTLGDLHPNLFKAAFLLQPSCLYMSKVEFYVPIYVFSGEKDEATRADLCKTMAESKRPIPVQIKIWKGAYHAFQDHYPIRLFHGYHIGYNADAAVGSLGTVLGVLTTKQ